ncbi:MAG: hypothetical protein ACE5JM_08140, partial [Armatimonadota bacterium]
MIPRHKYATCLSLVLGLALVEAQSPSAQGVPMPTSGAAVQIRLGLRDKEPAAWDGRLEVAPGRVVALVAPGRQAAQVTADGWKLKTRTAGQRQRQRRQIQPIVLLATLEAPPTAIVRVTTPKGGFAFALSDIPVGQAQQFLDGQASVQQLPLSTQLTTDELDNDFPSATVAPDGTIWLVHTSYQHGNPTELPDDASIPEDWSSFETKGNGDR